MSVAEGLRTIQLPLVGAQYTARSKAVAAQTCINLYAEPNQDPNEKEKGIGALFGCPGRSLAKTITSIDAAATPMRGMWSGGGRLFVAAGTKYMELDSSYNLVGSVRTIADDSAHGPVTFFANGTQLMIVSSLILGGIAYIDNGAGPTAVALPTLTGIATGLGLGTWWVSGDYFDPGMVGQNFTIGATTRVVQFVVSPTFLITTVAWPGAPTAGGYSSTPLMAVTSGAYLDGYFIVSRYNSKQFNWSPYGDGTNVGTYVWDANDRANKESWPDYIRSILVAGEQLWVFGYESYEVWQNSGLGIGNTPFTRIDGATGKLGSVSTFAPVASEGRVYMLGGDGGQTCAYVFEGFTPRRVSTFAEESEWNLYTLGPTFVSYTYLEEGHQFWVMNPGNGAATYVYDITTNLWHKRAKYTAGNRLVNPYWGMFHAFVSNSPSSTNNWGTGGKHILGGIISGEAGAIYESSVNLPTDSGSAMGWERTLPYIWNNGNFMEFKRFVLEMETGATAVSVAAIEVAWSDDRGQTFPAANTETIGTWALAEYDAEIFIGPMGMSKGRLYRIFGLTSYRLALAAVSLDIIDGLT